MSKSLRTQQHYASAVENQTQLDAFQFGAYTSKSLIPQVRRVSDHSTSSTESGESVEVHIISDDDHGVSVGPSIPESDVSVHPIEFSYISKSEDSDHPTIIAADEDSDSSEVITRDQRAEDLETWQEELEQDVSSHPTEIKDWATLRAQIRADLKKNAKKTFPNQQTHDSQ